MKIENIKKSKDIKAYIEASDNYLRSLKYTEHSYPHILKTAAAAKSILLELGYPQKDAELAEIAGYLHDIGNVVNRVAHAQSSALIAFSFLSKLDMNPFDIALVTTAIGNHDESTAFPNNHITAALIIADKADVRRTRVRNTESPSSFDIHDRVNYSVVASNIIVNTNEKTISLKLMVDTSYCPILDYFQIFLERMNLCKLASKTLNMRFKLIINDVCLL